MPLHMCPSPECAASNHGADWTYGIRTATFADIEAINAAATATGPREDFSDFLDDEWREETQQWVEEAAPLAVEALDWIDDESLDREQKLARFEALDPEPTRGPQ